MTMILNALAHLAFLARRSRVGLFGPLLALGAAVVLIMQARPEDFIDTTVYAFTAEKSAVAMYQKYVRVRGTLLPAQAVQGEVDIAGQSVQGSRYVPIKVDGMAEPIFVLDRDLPQVPAEGGPVDIVGLFSNKASFPPSYVRVENPPNIPLMNDMARAGILLGLITLLWLLLSWMFGRVDFALPSAGQAERRGLGLLWYGGLGSAVGNARVREAPVQLIRARHETRFQAADSREGWSVHVREFHGATPTTVATSFGALPALRLSFVDERGQRRAGTLVAGDVTERDRALDGLSCMARRDGAREMVNGSAR